MNLTLEQALGYRLMSSFAGHTASPARLEAVRRQPLGGFTLFRSLNVQSPAQVRALTAELQQAARAGGHPPLLLAADQEGGTLLAIGGTTPFPGNMALGAAGSADLARRVGRAIGQELAAMGLNVNYAPVCDVNVNPENPVVGVRSFGSDPYLVARLGAAMVHGLQSAGIAATAKHFPGHGDTAVDSHHATPVLPHRLTRLRQVELPPFAAAVQAGARLVMTGHLALPEVTGYADLPATLSPLLLRDVLRRDLGYNGVIISDALEMGAIEQGEGLAIDAIAAAVAGVDLFMLNSDPAHQQTIYQALRQATRRGLLPPHEVCASAERVLALKSWCSQIEQPGLEVVGCAEHQALAAEVAARSVTLVRDLAGRLPLRLRDSARVVVIRPELHDLSPADTSSYEKLCLAESLRAYHPAVDELVTPLDPTAAEVAGLRQRARNYDLAVIGTINATAHPGQADLVNAILDACVPVVAVALRLPYDALAYPAAPTCLCTYSLQPASMKALAQGLWGQLQFTGQLPVEVPGLELVPA